MDRYLRVQSRPVRVSSETLPRFRRPGSTPPRARLAKCRDGRPITTVELIETNARIFSARGPFLSVAPVRWAIDGMIPLEVGSSYFSAISRKCVTSRS